MGEVWFLANPGVCLHLWSGLHTQITCTCINTLRPKQNGRHFANDIFKYIFLNENVKILIKISPSFVLNGPINNIGPDIGLAPTRRQAIIWTNDG